MTTNFIILGAPRSGTGYASKLLKSYGYQVGHEILESDGISSWLWAANSLTVPCGTPKHNTTSKHTIHITRHPWKTISSLISTSLPNSTITDYMSQYIHIPTKNILKQALHITINWNKLIKAQNPDTTIQVEQLHPTLKTWLETNNYPTQDNPPPETNYNTKEYSKILPINLLTLLNKKEIKMLKEHAEKYGYELYNPHTT